MRLYPKNRTKVYFKYTHVLVKKQGNRRNILLFLNKQWYILNMSDMTLEEIDQKLEELREAKRQRIALAKRREIRRKAMNTSGFRNTENQIKYMLGGMILKIWGKKKAVETIEKSPSLTDYQKSVITKYKEHYRDEIAQEGKLVQENSNAESC